MSASSWEAQDADDAMSGSSWTAVADLEGEIEKLEVVGLPSRTEGGSVDPKGKTATG